MQLSEIYVEKFNVTYSEFVKSLTTSTLNNTEYCLFYPMFGKNYFDKKEILFIGRAVNNWGDIPWNSLENNVQVVEKAIDFSKPEVEGECAIDWVNQDWVNKDSNVSHSAF